MSDVGSLDAILCIIFFYGDGVKLVNIHTLTLCLNIARPKKSKLGLIWSLSHQTPLKITVNKKQVHVQPSQTSPKNCHMSKVPPGRLVLNIVQFVVGYSALL